MYYNKRYHMNIDTIDDPCLMVAYCCILGGTWIKYMGLLNGKVGVFVSTDD